MDKEYWKVGELTSEIVEHLLSDIPSDGSVTESECEDMDEDIVVRGDKEVATIVNDTAEIDNTVAEDTDEDIPTESVADGEIFSWSQIYSSTQTIEFSEVEGPIIDDNVETPTDIFLSLLTTEMLQKFVYETNLYSTQKHGGLNPTPTNCREIKNFIGINIFMGIEKLPSYRDFWSSDPKLRNEFVAKIMPVHRFGWLLTHFHINDNTHQPRRNEQGYDKLYKLRPFLNSLLHSFSKFYKPTKEQSIDESMILFKGRSCIKQYMPAKPIKRGYKVWVRADRHGYVCEFQVYTGRNGDKQEKDLGGRVVRDLSMALRGKGYEIYFDNYFTSAPLLKDLHRHQIYACGTLRKGRKNIPSDFKEDKSMSRGESQWRFGGGLTAMKWKDRRGILFLSNHHDPGNISSVSRMQKNGTPEEIICPKLVVDYNKNMGFVDKADMLKSTYEIDRKSKKWWHRIFFHFIDVTVVNSYILFKQRSEGSTLTLKDFRLALLEGLICYKGENKNKRKRESIAGTKNFKPKVSLEKRFCRDTMHLPVYGTQRRCAYCSTKAEPHRSRWSCKACEVALCLGDKKNCFLLFHSEY